MPSSIRPVILCGGSGTRLWPLSRERYPKQFAPLVGERSLFQQCVERLDGAPFGKPVIVTAAPFRFIVLEQIAEIGVMPADVLIEPEPRDTAPAVLAAALHVAAQDPDAVLFVAPSDHLIPDAGALRDAVAAGLDAAARGDLVTFGVEPDRPETGYGYLEVSGSGAVSAGGDDIAKLVRFVEKPDAAAAEAMIKAGDHFWNAGMFLGKAADFIEAFRSHAPDLFEPVRAAFESAVPDLGFLRLDPDAWSAVRPVSIDYAVMEKAANLSVVPLRSAWSDLGDWNAIWRESPKSENGMVCSDGAHGIDSEDSLLRTEGGDIELVGIGLRDMIVVAMPDAVIVAARDRSQDVRAAVELLRREGRPQATEFAARPAALGLVRDDHAGRAPSGEAHRGQSGLRTEPPEPRAPLRALDRRLRHGPGDDRRRGTALVGKRVGLRAARRDPPAGQPRKGGSSPHRGPDGRVSRRGRHHPLRGPVCAAERGVGRRL